MRKHKALKPVLGAGVSVFFIWLILRSLDLSATGAALRASDSAWICIAIAVFVLGYACRIQRWRLMLESGGAPVGFRQCAVPFLTSIAANNVLPFRAGDALRAMAFTRWLERGTATVLATMIAERALDLLTLLLALGLALVIFDAQVGGAEPLFGLGAVVLWSMAALGLAILTLPALFDPLIQRIFARVFGQDAAVTQAMATLLATLGHVVHGRRIIPLGLWSLLAWTLEGGVFYAVARAIPGITDPATAFMALPVATLSTLVPSTPGYAGTFHYFAIQSMELFDTPLATAAAFAFVVHLVLWLTATLAGGCCALIWMLSGRETSPLRAEHT